MCAGHIYFLANFLTSEARNKASRWTSNKGISHSTSSLQERTGSRETQRPPVPASFLTFSFSAVVSPPHTSLICRKEKVHSVPVSGTWAARSYFPGICGGWRQEQLWLQIGFTSLQVFPPSTQGPALHSSPSSLSRTKGLCWLQECWAASQSGQTSAVLSAL